MYRTVTLAALTGVIVARGGDVNAPEGVDTADIRPVQAGIELPFVPLDDGRILVDADPASGDVSLLR
jgi:hypothetical protein